MKQHTTSHLAIRKLCEGALMIALAEILSFLPLYKMPWGGSIDLAMLPIFVFCARWGFGKGMLASFCYSLLQLMLDGAYAWGWQSMIGDYIVAYTVLGIAGLFYKNKYGLYLGTVAGCAARFLVAYLVGVIIWGEYMPEQFFGMTMTTPWFYSALYNGSYMLVDMILCLVAAWLLYRYMGKYVRGEDLES